MRPSSFHRFLLLVVGFSLLHACAGPDEVAKGRTLLQEQKFAEAEAEFAKAITGDAQRAEAWYYRGVARLRQGAAQAAIPDFDKAIALAPGCSACQDSLGRYHFQRGLALFVSGNYSTGAADFEKSIALQHDLANAYAYLGVCKGFGGDDIAAIQALNTAVKTDPNNHFAVSNRGFYNSKVGDNRTAIADFSKAIALKPDDKMSYLNRGYTYIGQQDYETAILDFKKALEIDPNYAGALTYMGIAYTNTDRPQEALPYLDKAISITPENGALYYYRGAARISVGMKEAGCTDLNQALQLGDDQGVALIQAYCQ
jgi:tetratricopeptide (TPR) repeat protein